VTKFIIRVDDVGQALDQTQADSGLLLFRKWWEAGRWDGLPIYLGVVPTFLDDEAKEWLRDNLHRPAEIALHGWDHVKQVLTELDVERGRAVFPDSRCVIPPYNLYDERTVKACNGMVLFGGFDGEHHNYGPDPIMVENCLHLPADRKLYSHAYRLVRLFDHDIENGLDYEHEFRVITLHHRWDAGFLDGVGRLRDAIADRLATVDEVYKMLEVGDAQAGVGSGVLRLQENREGGG